MILRTGLDLIEIERIQGAIERHGARFLNRVFTPLEQAQAGGSAASLAARFAAKEAAAKALGCGIGLVAWLEIEVERLPGGAPSLRLSGAAAQLAQEVGVHTWALSLTHTHSTAAAAVVAMGE